MKEPKKRAIYIRVTEKQLNRLRFLAKTYANGNLSKWMLHNGINGKRRYLK